LTAVVVLTVQVFVFLTDGNGLIDKKEWTRGYAEYTTMLRIPDIEVTVSRIVEN